VAYRSSHEASGARVPNSPVSGGEGEIGCLFDEISNLVEPIERSATMAELGRLAMDGVISPERPDRRRILDQTRNTLSIWAGLNRR
jgi:hypothetical protein